MGNEMSKLSRRAATIMMASAAGALAAPRIVRAQARQKIPFAMGAGAFYFTLHYVSEAGGLYAQEAQATVGLTFWLSRRISSPGRSSRPATAGTGRCCRWCWPGRTRLLIECHQGIAHNLPEEPAEPAAAPAAEPAGETAPAPAPTT